MAKALNDAYALIPIAFFVRNQFSGIDEVYDVSSLEPPGEWREGYENWTDEAEAAQRDDAFIAAAQDAMRECFEHLARHFHSIGAVVVPRLRDDVVADIAPGMGLIVPADDAEMASSLAHIWTSLPPVGRLRSLFVETDSHWSSSACPQTIGELFSAAQKARENPESWSQGLPMATARLPLLGEGVDEWVARVAVAPEQLRQTAAAWEASCQDLNLFSMHPLSIGNRDGEIIDWLIPGLIQRGEVTSLVGPGGVGKTTALAELVAKVGDSPNHGTQFLGTSINHSNGLCAYISAEDRQGVMKLRIEQYQAPGSALNAFLIDGCGRAIEECLALLEALPSLDLVIVDPVTQFVDDENEAGKVGPFYNSLSTFARRKNCAVIAVHHLTKSKGGGRTGNVRNAIRGSSVHVDRPRLVFCMLPKGDGLVEVGIVKSNVPPGQPAWSETGSGRLFRQMPAGLVGITPPGETSRDIDTAPLRDWIVKQVSQHNERGWVVRRTGRKSLFGLLRGPDLKFSRSAIEQGVSDLIARRQLIDHVDQGLMSIPAGAQ